MKHGVLVIIGEDVTYDDFRRVVRKIAGEGAMLEVIRLSHAAYEEVYDFQDADFEVFVQELTGKETLVYRVGMTVEQEHEASVMAVRPVRTALRSRTGSIKLPCGIFVDPNDVADEIAYSLTYDDELFNRGAMLRGWINRVLSTLHPELSVVGVLTSRDELDVYALRALGVTDEQVYTTRDLRDEDAAYVAARS